MRTTALLLAGGMLLATTLPAQGPQYPQKPRQGRGPSRFQKADAWSFRKLKVPGEQVAANVKRLTKELHWHRTLAGALASGRTKGKPVLWIQALGDLKGFL